MFFLCFLEHGHHSNLDMFKKSGYIKEVVLYGMDGYHTVAVVCSNFVKFFETINYIGGQPSGDRLVRSDVPNTYNWLEGSRTTP